jgi:8-oxo-dGTP pyrophosphatase MutT (NUDIX family)
VDHHEVLNPAGRPGIYGTVHYKNHAVGVIPIDDAGNIVMVGQFRFPLGEYSWEIPEGGGPLDVPFLDSARRELREECGLTADSWHKLLEMDLSNSVTDEKGTVFLAWDLTDSPHQHEESELLQLARMPFREALERVKNGEIRDSLTVAGLLRLGLMAAQGELPPALTDVVR